jgi:hypothetical protein
MSSEKPILCSKCKVQVQVVPDAKPDDKVTCPDCGDSDTFENVMRSLGDQAQEWAEQKLSASLKAAGWKMTPGNSPKRVHRFVVNLN